MSRNRVVRGISLVFALAAVFIAIVVFSGSGGSDVPDPATPATADNTPDAAAPEIPQVFMTSEITSEALVKMYEVLERDLGGKVGVKLSTGEPGGHNFLDPQLIKELVQRLDGTIVEANTAYGGPRSSSAMHKQVAVDHGFTAIAPFDLLDEEGDISLPFPDGVHLKEDFVGSHFADYDSYLILTHFKGHAMGGFGGSLKNISIGFASAEGKTWIHSAGKSRNLKDIFPIFRNTVQDDFLESMAEASGAIMQAMGDNIVYINVMNNLSVDCDCDNSPAPPTMADVGILASLDPVALDRACVDLVYAAHDGHDLIERMESRNGAHILDHAESLGLGIQEYHLVSVDG